MSLYAYIKKSYLITAPTACRIRDTGIMPGSDSRRLSFYQHTRWQWEVRITPFTRKASQGLSLSREDSSSRSISAKRRGIRRQHCQRSLTMHLHIEALDLGRYTLLSMHCTDIEWVDVIAIRRSTTATSTAATSLRGSVAVDQEPRL